MAAALMEYYISKVKFCYKYSTDHLQLESLARRVLVTRENIQRLVSACGVAHELFHTHSYPMRVLAALRSSDTHTLHERSQRA